MLSFPSQNDKKKCPTDQVYSKKLIGVMANQHIFISDLSVYYDTT